MKKCACCNKNKSESEYYKDHRVKSGYSGTCKECVNKRSHKWMIKKYGSKSKYYSEYTNRIQGGNPRVMYSKKKCNAISHNILFNISVHDFVEWYNKQDKKCFYCDLPAELVELNKYKMSNINIFRLTLDRLNSEEGYVIDNIVLCCGRCNLTKSNFFTSSEMREIAQKYITPKWIMK